jgi:hypothetical protein
VLNDPDASLRDLHLVLKEHMSNPFSHGWLAAHFGWPRDALAGNDGRPFHKSPQINQTAIDSWYEGYDMAMETTTVVRCIALSKMLTLEFE